jgi:hypothetical protein
MRLSELKLYLAETSGRDSSDSTRNVHSFVYFLFVALAREVYATNKKCITVIQVELDGARRAGK